MGIRKQLLRLAKHFQSPPSAKLGFSFDPFGWLLTHDPAVLPELAVSNGLVVDDNDLVRRVMRSYKGAFSNFVPSTSFWDGSVRKLNADVHDALSSTDEKRCAEFLRNPANNAHFWGFDAIASAPKGKQEPHESLLKKLNQSMDWRKMYAVWLYDGLKSFADVVGARRLSYPEAGRFEAYVTPDNLLDQIEDAIGQRLMFPNPYAGELGLSTSRGIASFRSIQSLYQGWRVAQFAKSKKSFRVLEIGAGLGRTAYFAYQFGVHDYTIIDIPLTGAAQGYFLGRVLGENHIRLFGESEPAGINIVPASELNCIEGTFDLILNVDSFTEMSAEVLHSYWRYSLKNSGIILSINHEENPLSVRSLYTGDPTLSVLRYPYWMRRGYVEEIITVGS